METRLEQYLKENNHEFHIEKTNIGVYAHSEANKKKPCFLCSRFRRKRMIELAEKFNCQKIALGHHKDDTIETLLINIFYGREISTMMPNQPLFDGKYHIIRPLVYIWERKIKEYGKMNNFPLFDNKCPSENNSKRLVVKNILKQLEKDHRIVKENVFKSLKHVRNEYLWNDFQKKDIPD